MTVAANTGEAPLAIRAATLREAAAIASLVSQLGYPSSSSEMGERLSVIMGDPQYATLLAEAAGGIVGIVGVRLGRYYERNGAYAQLVVLAVEKQSRGRGIGRALVAAAEAWAVDQGARSIAVQSGKHRTEAHRFYERLGYVRTGLRFVKDVERAAQQVGVYPQPRARDGEAAE